MRGIERSAETSKYAHREREQRWLLRASPAEAGVAATIAIEDRYLTGTRLRLRRVESDGVVVFKLAQKVRTGDGSPHEVSLTNIYLDASEYALLAALPASVLTKTRRRLPALSVDEFHDALDGLVLAEVELREGEPRRAAPASAVADVTGDDRFSGGALATTTAADLRELLASFGL
ncbi:MAG TPA: hypothetical protein VF230_02430 [Acidimicrobiales bacterium]